MKFNLFFRPVMVLSLIIFTASSFAQITVATKTTKKQTMSTSSDMDNGFRRWSVELNGGLLQNSVVTGGSNDFSKNLATLGYGADVKFQINHFLAIQADVIRGKLKGNQDRQLGDGTKPNRAVTSFTTDMHYAASASGVITFGSVTSRGFLNKIVPYIAVGGGLANYDSKIVKRGTTVEVPYPSTHPITEFFVPVTAGLKYHLSNSVNLDLAYRAQWVDGDNFNGFISSINHKDKFSYGFVGIEFPLGKKSKPQLMFDNPLAIIQTELQRQIDSLKSVPPFTLRDTDGDGVPDELDMEPNTPKGCPVDTHGVMRDTDGDGVPDCKDKELNTPTMCQPVDADGVGKCPPPDCCKALASAATAAAEVCSIGDLPSVSFKSSSLALKAETKAILSTIAEKLKTNPLCNIVVTSFPAASKASASRCQARLALIRKYLIETEGISTDRVATNCAPGTGDENTVDFKSVTK